MVWGSRLSFAFAIMLGNSSNNLINWISESRLRGERSVFSLKICPCSSACGCIEWDETCFDDKIIDQSCDGCR